MRHADTCKRFQSDHRTVYSIDSTHLFHFFLSSFLVAKTAAETSRGFCIFPVTASILQYPFEPGFPPLQCAPDGASVHAPVSGDLGQGLFLEVIGMDRVALQGRQLPAHYLAQPPQLDLMGQVVALETVK